LFWDFIRMNALSKNNSPNAFSPLSSSRLSSLALHGGIGCSGTGTADSSAGHQ
jgi:hypothetical protein